MALDGSAPSLAQVGSDERTNRHDAQVFGVGPLEGEFDQCVAQMSAPKLLRDLSMNELQRLRRPLVNEERDLPVVRQLETTGCVIVNDCHSITLRGSASAR